MSSTGRGDSRVYHVKDYYVTPVLVVENFLKEFGKWEPDAFKGARVLDPSAGGDHVDGMSYPTAIRNLQLPIAELVTIDIRPDSHAILKGDYFEIDCSNRFEVIISNPPFICAQNFIVKCLQEVCDAGFVIMLQRLNFMGSEVRRKFWQLYPPKYVFVHNSRISFTGDGNTDSIEYCHYVWQKGYSEPYGKIIII